MIYVWTVLIIALSAILGRIRGGMEICGKDVPARKVWYAVAFAIYSCYTLYFGWEIALTCFIACYESYQLFGYGVYAGRLLLGGTLDPQKDRECELIDDKLYALHLTIKGKTYYLYEHCPRIFGFLGMTLTGFIITSLWGFCLCNLTIMLSGLCMGICFYLGSLLNKLKEDGKGGWNWAEWLFWGTEGAFLAKELLW